MNSNKTTGSTISNKFELTLHIGAGKTGTTSIQKTLEHQRVELNRQRVFWLGLMLEHAPNKQFSWQKPGGIHDFLPLPAPKRTEQVLKVLRAVIPRLQSEGYHRAIWSNEWFFEHGSESLIDVMEQIAHEGIDIKVIVYLRRHDAWIRSAYVQWGLKHKTYKGPLQPFSEWVQARPRLLSFYQKIEPWIKKLGPSVIVRNLDTTDNVVTDFLRVVGIDPGRLEIRRTNETPSGEELILRAIFNSNYEDKVPVNRFDQFVGNDIAFDKSLEERLVQLLPTDNDLHDVRERCAGDRAAINSLLIGNGQPGLADSPLSTQRAEVDMGRTLSALAQIVTRQARAIQRLDDRVRDAVKQSEKHRPPITLSENNTSEDFRNPGLNSPVFAISTGRSGSTLVQRVLNCHRDLVVWGEHFGFLNSLADAYVEMKNPKQKLYQENKGPGILMPTLKDPSAQLEWVNPCDIEGYKKKIMKFMDMYFGSRLADGQRWGFKEIRYNSVNTLRMLHDLYPSGRFVFIQRNPLEVTRSKVFSFVKEDKWDNYSDQEKKVEIRRMLSGVREHYILYDTFSQSNPDCALTVQYEDLVSDPEMVITSMLEHLNLDIDKYDWGLAEQVMSNVIAKTKRDNDVMELIRLVGRDMGLCDYRGEYVGQCGTMR